jgi:predicted amidohydrolase YtcJ
MLIRDAEIHGQGTADLRLEGRLVTAINTLQPRAGEPVILARGGALLPGLHDHHLHLAALAVREASVFCGPPQVSHRDALIGALSQPGEGWLRATGFCESILGGTLPDARMLDTIVPSRPLRMQHRTGRMWFLNSLALAELLDRGPAPPGLERENGHFTGRLFDEDRWLQQTLGSTPPDFAATSSRLAASGITGITDLSPRNDPAMARHFAAQRAVGALKQSVVLGGALSLASAQQQDGWRLGPAKLHLHESALPDFEEASAWITQAHDQGRGVAVHCVTEVELVFTLALLEAAGSLDGDRIEHASVVSPELAARLANLNLKACVQPQFVAGHGDRYLAEVETRHHPDLYRLRSLQDAGICLAGGSDAPYGSTDPWAGMRAAVQRRTAAGVPFTPEEALTPEQALALYLSDPLDLSRQRRIAVGEQADLCLLDRTWQEARGRLDSGDVRMTIASGRVVHQRIDQTPGQRLASAEPAAA